MTPFSADLKKSAFCPEPGKAGFSSRCAGRRGPETEPGKTAGLEDHSDLTGTGADAYPNGFFLLLFPACCDCLEI
jgi:hypothetical protein